MAHVMEPSLVGACENIINFGELWDSDKLFNNRAEIAAIYKEYSAMQAQATRFISAAACFISDTERLAASCMNSNKIAAFCERFIRRELKNISGNSKEETRLFSAVTPDGITYFDNSIKELADRIFVIEDEWGAASATLMVRLKALLCDMGANVIVGVSPFFPKTHIEQLILPDLDTAIILQTRLLVPKAIKPYRVYHARRFMDVDAMSEHRERLIFNRRAVRELIACASETMECARNKHNSLESHYISAMDFTRMEEVIERVNYEIFEK